MSCLKSSPTHKTLMWFNNTWRLALITWLSSIFKSMISLPCTQMKVKECLLPRSRKQRVSLNNGLNQFRKPCMKHFKDWWSKVLMTMLTLKESNGCLLTLVKWLLQLPRSLGAQPQSTTSMKWATTHSHCKSGMTWMRVNSLNLLNWSEASLLPSKERLLSLWLPLMCMLVISLMVLSRITLLQSMILLGNNNSDITGRKTLMIAESSKSVLSLSMVMSTWVLLHVSLLLLLLIVAGSLLLVLFTLSLELTQLDLLVLERLSQPRISPKLLVYCVSCSTALIRSITKWWEDYSLVFANKELGLVWMSSTESILKSCLSSLNKCLQSETVFWTTERDSCSNQRRSLFNQLLVFTLPWTQVMPEELSFQTTLRCFSDQ